MAGLKLSAPNSAEKEDIPEPLGPIDRPLKLH
jgi:hypothetical protein